VYKLIDFSIYLIYIIPIIYIWYLALKKSDKLLFFIAVNTTLYYIGRLLYFYVNVPFQMSSILVFLINTLLALVSLFIILKEGSSLRQVEKFIVLLSLVSLFSALIPYYGFSVTTYIYSLKESFCVFAGVLLLIEYRIHNKLKEFHYKTLTNYTIMILFATGISQLLFNFEIYRYSLDQMYHEFLSTNMRGISWNLGIIIRYWGYFNDFRESYLIITIFFIVTFYYCFFKKDYNKVFLLLLLYLLCNFPNLERTPFVIAFLSISPILIKLVKNKKVLKYSSAVAIGIFLIMVLLISNETMIFISKRMAIQLIRLSYITNITHSGTVISRYELWSNALQNIRNNILGNGIAYYLPSGKQFLGNLHRGSPHNEFLLLLASNGVFIGGFQVILIFMIYFSFGYTALRKFILINIACFICFTGYMINAFFNYSFFGNVSRFTLWGVLMLKYMSRLSFKKKQQGFQVYNNINLKGGAHTTRKNSTTQS